MFFNALSEKKTIYTVLSDTPARFARQPRLDLRPNLINYLSSGGVKLDNSVSRYIYRYKREKYAWNKVFVLEQNFELV